MNDILGVGILLQVTVLALLTVDIRRMLINKDKGVQK